MQLPDFFYIFARRSMMNSLSARLTYRIMAVILAMTAIIAGVVYFTVRKYMRDEAKERYINLLMENHQEIRRKLSSVAIAVENNVHDIVRDLDDPDEVATQVERIIKTNPTIVRCGVLYEPGYFPDKGRCYAPLATCDDDSVVQVGRIDSDYNNYIDKKWFQRCLKEDKSGWSEAYFEENLLPNNNTPRQLVTCYAPIHNRQGRPVAALCADISLEDIRARMMKDITMMNEQYEKGEEHQSYFFIIDPDGIYVFHPDRQRVMTHFDHSVGKMMKLHRGECETEVDGVKSWLNYRGIKENNWCMVIVTPEDAVLSNARKLNVIILLVMLLGLLAIYLFCQQQIKGIADPFAMQKANLEHELKIANGIQMAMLPKALNSPLHTEVDLFAMLTPARDVGGDLYDYFLRDNRLFFCIGDVSGKGVPAALMMAVVRAMFRSETRRADSAAAIVDTMNRSICEESTAGYFVTMFVGILDLTTGHLDYCNAGHEPPLIRNHPLNVKLNLPVGALPDWNYEGQQTQLQPDEMLFLYTDGLSEAMNTAGEQFGRKHVHQLADKHCNDTAQQLVELMKTEVNRHTGDAQQSDDITLLVIKWQPNHLMMPASMDDISRLEPFITHNAKQAGLEDRETKRLRLAVEEAVANVINYGQATTINLHASVEGNQLVLTIDDDGQPFDPTAGSSTDLSIPADERPPGGLGIIFLHKMTDGLSYERKQGHNVLTIRKNNKVKV